MQSPHAQRQTPQVSIVGRRMVVSPATVRVAMVWLRQDGRVQAKFPADRGNRRWLHNSVRIRSPHWKDGWWHLPRNCVGRLVTAAVDRYGYAAVCRDIAQLSRCTRACLEATGVECNCSCFGAHHGQDSGGWYERAGDVVVADLGEFSRSAVLYRSCGQGAGAGDAVLYRGELHGRFYRADRAGRLDWPAASSFMCVGCLTARASVWDHCHTHHFVRAPLCNACNTRAWGGWDPAHGRVGPSSNLDTSYYEWCPRYGDFASSRCSV